MTTSKKAMVALLLTLTAGAACGVGEDVLEVRTFPLSDLEEHEASALVSAYVYQDRDGAAGTFATTRSTLTVRETPDNLAKIERVLSQYDIPRADVRLHFQLIEADGFTDSDPRIATVEVELRKIFQFRGYRLAGEGVVSATDGSSIGQTIKGTDDLYEITGQVYWTGPGQIRLDDIGLYAESGRVGLKTTMNIRPGQTIVLGSSPKPESTATLLLTVRAEEVSPSNQ